jgi:hypothetical protein
VWSSPGQENATGELLAKGAARGKSLVLPQGQGHLAEADEDRGPGMTPGPRFATLEVPTD